ncbi:MAG: NAD(P)/FAD-dependent oxidoreductase [Bacteroidetes bacterium]|nr:NAD(P)/FAD-dependent oxidoreductase [Bacteroidota bacterium]
MNDLGIPETFQKRIVIIGGGFGGLKLSELLSPSLFQIVLLDKNNYHNFQPLLYQVATGGLEAESIAYPLRKSLGKNVFFRMMDAEIIFPEKNLVQTSAGNLSYDFLVIASGSKPNFYGIKSIEKNSFTLKSVPDALDIRSWLFQNLETAAYEKEIVEPLSVVIAGGGPTGVEVAGALADMKNHILPRDYRELNFRLAKIYLIEAGERLLGAMSIKSSEHAYNYLRTMGVEIILKQSVKSFDGNEVLLSDGRIIHTKIFLWNAGVIGNFIPGLKEECILKNQRIAVDAYNKVSGYTNIFAIGDAACAEQPHPMLAPAAIQQAKNLAHNLNLSGANHAQWKKFQYTDKGVLATVGRNKAVSEIKNIKLYGFIAWLIWVFVHLMALVGFRNRVIVFTNWVINYFSYNSAIRLIIHPAKKIIVAREKAEAGKEVQ